jgi:hypothetical protein
MNVISPCNLRTTLKAKQNLGPSTPTPQNKYRKGRCGRFFVKLSIHPFIPSSIHGWHHTGKKTLAEINTGSDQKTVLKK